MYTSNVAHHDFVVEKLLNGPKESSSGFYEELAVKWNKGSNTERYPGDEHMQFTLKQ